MGKVCVFRLHLKIRYVSFDLKFYTIALFEAIIDYSHTCVHNRRKATDMHRIGLNELNAVQVSATVA